jgi:hypothetical protein
MDDLEEILLHCGIIQVALTIAASVWSKISFALSLLRIASSGCTEVTKRVIWFVIVTLSVMLVFSIAIILATCKPMEKLWRPVVEGKCLGATTQWVGAVSVAGTHCTPFVTEPAMHAT